MQAKPRIREHVRCIAAVPREAGEYRLVAEIFVACGTVRAGAVRPSEPRDADTIAYFKSVYLRTNSGNSPDDFVTRYDWKRALDFSIGYVEIGPADAAGSYFDQDVAPGSRRNVTSDFMQGLAGTFELHCSHLHQPLARAPREGSTRLLEERFFVQLLVNGSPANWYRAGVCSSALLQHQSRGAHCHLNFDHPPVDDCSRSVSVWRA
jgi:hypothetical protein